MTPRERVELILWRFLEETKAEMPWPLRVREVADQIVGVASGRDESGEAA